MRDVPQTDNDNDPSFTPKRGRKNLIQKYPNKHHEGDRKRWRNEITERERKRYEGVWAANKGLYFRNMLDTTGSSIHGHGQGVFESDRLVLNIIVRDIWSRSRLASEVLCEVWELVDRQQAGILDREEFVVGMWLIDQRLKGRKLPIKVSSSVWSSARHLGEVKVPKARP